MQDLTEEQIEAVEKAMLAHRHKMKKVADFINDRIKDKHGKDKSMSMHMRTDYLACALDELNERVTNSFSLYAYTYNKTFSDLLKRIEKLEEKVFPKNV
jgi:hypothetical protein